MIRHPIRCTLLVTVLSAGLVGPAWAADAPLRLVPHHSPTGLGLSWPGTARSPDGSIVRPFFEVQQSTDLRRWTVLGERLRAPLALGEGTVTFAPPSSSDLGFYRLLQFDPPAASRLAANGGEVFGYDDALSRELKRIGQITPDQFGDLFASGVSYLPTLTWDPTTAQYWSEFAKEPATVNEAIANDGRWPPPRGFRLADYRLDTNELALLQKNGFVVSERLGTLSFGDMFYALWHADLPVFISCDAILQAWHRTYDAILEEAEEVSLFNALEQMLDGMAGQLAAAAAQAGNGTLHASLLDADYFLTVARSLLKSPYVPPPSSWRGNTPPLVETTLIPLPTAFGQDGLVKETLNDIKAEQLKLVPDFMGFCRMGDFSQFKVRGHYTHTERLGRYFRCMMWLGRIDIPVAGGPWERCPDVLRFASPRELGTAIVLWHLLNTSGHFDRWRDLERTISTFVGTTDSLNFGQLGGLLAGAGIRDLTALQDDAALERLQSDILQGQLGVQNIRSDWFEQPLGGAVRYGLPRTFSVFGQKFVPDSWALSQSVFSSILWMQNGQTNKVQRRVPGALDIAFSVLGNEQIVPELVAQMKGTFPDPNRPHAQKFRDGLPYQHNLAAVRSVIKQQNPTAWDSNIYMQWLDTLRALSAPSTDSRYPEAMRTRAWAMKTLNTQLASWTQLRHDTILYAKQSYTDFGACVYPRGFVEPREEFWLRLGQLAERAADQISVLPAPGDYPVATNLPPQLNAMGEVVDPGGQVTNLVAVAAIQKRQVAHLRGFAKVVSQLHRLAQKELAQECFAPDEEKFIDGLMEMNLQGTCTGINWYTGWYPGLFYRTIYWNVNDLLFHQNYGCDAFDGLVADVHTDVPCEWCNDDPGSVLHQAVGKVNLLMLAVDHGGDHFICAGPVLSHYEFEVTGEPRRFSDQEWQAMLSNTPPPYPVDVPANRVEGFTPPPWTRSYLAPQNP